MLQRGVVDARQHQQPRPVPSRRQRARRRADRRNRNLHRRLRIATDGQTRFAQLEPTGLFGNGFTAQQRDDAIERLVHARAQIDRRQAEHLGVRWQGARPGAEHHAAARHVIELRHRFGHHERMMIGQRFDARAQPDVLGALRRRGNEDFGSGDDLEAAGMMLADPRLVEAKPVQQRHELQVAFQGVGGVEIGGMERPHEHAETQRTSSGTIHVFRILTQGRHIVRPLPGTST